MHLISLQQQSARLRAMRESRNIQTSACTLQDFLPPLRALCLLLIAPGFIWAQASTQKLDSSPNSSAAELSALREALLQTQKQVALQQEEIESLNQRLGARQPVSVSTRGEAPQVIGASMTQPVLRSGASYAGANVADRPVAQDEGKDKESPLSSFKLGDAILTPGGFVDLENIFRTTNTQSNIATNFAAIPFSNTALGSTSEFRSTAQFSRLNFKIEDHFRGTDFLGYVEGDFSGNSAPNVYQSVNGLTNRLRLYFGYARRGKWVIVGGQTWSWLTPNREGIGPIPSDLAITYNEDQNLAVGVPYTRAAEFRVAYHVNDHWAMGVGIENSNQFIGNYVALPAGFSSIGSQFDNNANAGAANLMPDILGKTTYDTKLSGRHFHAELTGFLTGAHASVMPTGSTTFH